MSKNLKDLPEAEYRALKLESFSSLKALLSSVGEFKYLKENPFKGNNATLLGTAVHHYIQGEQKLVFVNDFNRTTKEGKEKYTEFMANLPSDGIILTKTQGETLEKIYKNFLNSKKCVEILKGCEFELPFIMPFNIDGKDIKIKGKLDAVNVTEGYTVEIKTSSAYSNIEEFREGSKQMQYDMQAALYTLMLEHEYKKPFKHYFIVANTREPYNVERYTTSDKYLSDGKVKLNKALFLYKRHILDGVPEDEIEEEL